jgi:hypothetical protein
VPGKPTSSPEYLTFLRGNRGQEPIALAAHERPAHLSHPILPKVEELKILLIVVPRGGRAVDQPLDRRVYGAVKSKGRSKFDRMGAFSATQPWNKELAAKGAEEYWSEVTRERIIDARHLQGTHSGWDSATEFADDEGAQEDAALHFEFGHVAVDMADILAIDERDADDNREQAE